MLSNLCFARCDADPAALAKYVLALIKKDKTIEELKESMVSQMDVFLQVKNCLLLLASCFLRPAPESC